MARIVLAINLLVATLAFITCERENVYDLATLGFSPKTAIYVYHIGQVNGDLDGRDTIDRMCFNQGLPYHKTLDASTVKALVSMDSFDQLRLVVPPAFWGYPVIGISNTLATTLIATSWSGMVSGYYENSIDVALGIGGMNWWSGSLADGSFDTTYNCLNWSTSDPLQSGQVGTNTLSTTQITCDIPAYLLCIAY